MTLVAVAAPGEIDDSFGNGGFVTRPSTGSWSEGVLNVALQPDGKILALGLNSSGGYVLWRLNVDGSSDMTFGASGVVDLGKTVCRLTYANCFYFRPMALDASGGILVAFSACPPGCPNNVYSVARLTAAGAVDATFGKGGLAQASTGISDTAPQALAIAPDGRIVVAGTSTPYGCIQCPSVAVFQADGSVDSGFGDAGRSVIDVQGALRAIAIQDDGKIVVVGTSGNSLFSAAGQTQALIARYGADGQLDASFAGVGLLIDSADKSFANAVLIQPDGNILVAGDADPGGGSEFLLMRLHADGTLDRYFGNAGRVIVPVAVGVQEFATTGGAVAMSLQMDGRIVLVGSATSPVFGAGFYLFRVAIARFNLDGTPDFTYAPGGSTTLWTKFGVFAQSAAALPDGRVVIGGGVVQGPPPGPNSAYPSLMMVLRIQGGAAPKPTFLHQALAVEYYEAAWNHYFITATAPEIAALDTFPQFRGWQRTGQGFKVVAEPGFGQSVVCRFFSGTTFAPKSSHFYTPYPDECAEVQQEPEWLYEGGVFFLRLPVGALGSRTCAPGDAPLYRLYNNGQGGAPNHRYTTELAIYNAMISMGWIPEGEAQTKLFACLPSQ